MQATLLKYKTKNQIFNDFITVSKSALELFGCTDRQFRQLNQIYKISILKPTIFISVITNIQQGSQYRTKKKNEQQESSGITTNFTRQEVQIRFLSLRREKGSDTLDTLGATDALKLIKEYLQSEEGINQLAAMGYAQYRSTDVQEQSFTNDSDNFQFLPYFDCAFIYTNSWSTPLNEITKVKPSGIYKV